MAAGSGFKTFATGDVLTAADTNGYLMQGVWVFADAAARTAAVTSPQEGNMSYLKDTNSTEYYSGSAWVAVGGSSGLKLINRSTFSATGSHIVDSVFSSTYKNYIIVIEYIYGATSTDELQMQLRYGTTTQAANYLGASRGVDSSLNLTTVASNGVTAFKLWERIGSSGTPSQYHINIGQVGNSSQVPQWHGTGIYGNTPYSIFTGGECTTSQTYTGFLLKSSSSNITGAVSVYGLATS